MNNTLKILSSVLLISTILFSCKKGGDDGGDPPPPPPRSFSYNGLLVNGAYRGFEYYNVNRTPDISIRFSDKISQTSATQQVTLQNGTGANVPVTITLSNGDSTINIRPTSALPFLTRFNLNIPVALQSQGGGKLQTAVAVSLITGIDSSRKFPQISDNDLLDTIQRRTFRYFWDFAHPTSKMARERSNGDNNVVTSGGTGFGIMAIVAGIDRGFVTRQQGLTHLNTLVDFLLNEADTIHGAYSHWLNGTTGAIQPFSPQDNGADLVETSFLIQGLITAREYFNGTGAEAAFRTKVNQIWHNVEWDWFRRGGQNTLYWHYSRNLGWAMNMQIKGWNECLITYVLAASSPTHPITKAVYDEGWASNGNMRNGNSYYGVQLPLGPPQGGPMFLSHYSFLGINPNGLSDAYANYQTQTRNHALINYKYSQANPLNYFGYSDSVWGLTASDIQGGYTASSPTNDQGFIAPTAAIASLPYTPAESMAAIKFFYYVLGDRLFKEYGFVDAFSLHKLWFANSFLAIDQAPIMVMIENYRSGLLWNLFSNAPEIKTGMRALGFSAPYLN